VKKVKNRSIYGEDMDKKLRLTFWPHPVYVEHKSFALLIS